MKTNVEIDFDAAAEHLLTNLQRAAVRHVIEYAKSMSTDKYPVEIDKSKIEWNNDYIWLTLDTFCPTAGEGNMLAALSRNHWFVKITRRGKTTVHCGPHWVSKRRGMHLAKDGLFL